MPQRNLNDPYGGNAPLVDHMLGTAYDVVRHVARHIKAIEKIACNMGAVLALANDARFNRVVEGVVPAAGATLNIPLPTDIAVSKIVGFDVLVKTVTGDMYPLGSGEFSARVTGGNLEFITDATPVAGIVGEKILWTIFYKGDLNVA